MNALRFVYARPQQQVPCLEIVGPRPRQITILQVFESLQTTPYKSCSMPGCHAVAKKRCMDMAQTRAARRHGLQPEAL